MLLLELKKYIEDNKSASLMELSNHFHLRSEVIEKMLDAWIDKGIIEKHASSIENLPSCMQTKDCPRCMLKSNPEAMVSFSFIDKPSYHKIS